MTLQNLEDFTRQLYTTLGKTWTKSENLLHPCTKPEHLIKGVMASENTPPIENIPENNSKKPQPSRPLKVENNGLTAQTISFQRLFEYWSNRRFIEWAQDRVTKELQINPESGMSAEQSVEYSRRVQHYALNGESLLMEQLNSLANTIESTYKANFEAFWSKQIVEQISPHLFTGVIPSWNLESTHIEEAVVSDQIVNQFLNENSAEYANARAVGLLYKENGDPSKGRSNLKTSSCTAFLISKSLVITNEHCLTQDKSKVSHTAIRFGYDQHLSGEFFKCGKLEYSDPGLDLAVLRCEENIYGKLPGEVYGYLALSDQLPRPDETLYFIGHPSGDKKHISFGQHSRSLNSNSKLNYYINTRTREGSSGSPLFSQNGHKVVGLVYSVEGNKTAAIKMSFIIQALMGESHLEKDLKLTSYFANDRSLSPSIVSGRPYSMVEDYQPIAPEKPVTPKALNQWRQNFTEMNYRPVDDTISSSTVASAVVQLSFLNSVYKRRSTSGLEAEFSGRSKCSGTVISNDLILTNAHCAQGNTEMTFASFALSDGDGLNDIRCPLIVARNNALDMAILQCNRDLSQITAPVSLSMGRNFDTQIESTKNQFYTIFFIGQINGTETHSQYYAEGRFEQDATVVAATKYIYPPFQRSKEGTSGSSLFNHHHAAIVLNYGGAENYNAEKTSESRFVNTGTPMYAILEYLELENPNIFSRLHIVE